MTYIKDSIHGCTGQSFINKRASRLGEALSNLIKN
jgi:hypothetical protein